MIPQISLSMRACVHGFPILMRARGSQALLLMTARRSQALLFMTARCSQVLLFMKVRCSQAPEREAGKNLLASTAEIPEIEIHYVSMPAGKHCEYGRNPWN